MESLEPGEHRSASIKIFKKKRQVRSLKLLLLLVACCRCLLPLLLLLHALKILKNPMLPHNFLKLALE